MVLLKAQEWWDPLRSDPRFQDLMLRVGHPLNRKVEVATLRVTAS